MMMLFFIFQLIQFVLELNLNMVNDEGLTALILAQASKKEQNEIYDPMQNQRRLDFQKDKDIDGVNKQNLLFIY